MTVDWRDPSKGVLGGSGVCIVHYSDGITNRNNKVAASPSQYVIMNLINGHTYTISVEATSQHLSGESENMTITLSESQSKMLGNVLVFSPIVPLLEAPDRVTVSARGCTSIQVSWQAVENADRYNVTLTTTEGAGQLGLCPSSSHIVSVNTTNLSVTVGQTDDDMLRAYTTYSVTVVAERDTWPYRSSNGSEIIMTSTTQISTCN